jgi:ribosomal subunit interface protein
MDAQTARRALGTNIRARPGDRRTGRESSAIPAAAGDAEQTGLVNRPSSPQRGPAEGRAVTAVGIVVNGRNVAVPEHFRVYVAKKMAPVVERYGHNVPHYDVELFHEKNRRQSKLCQRIQITGTGHGPILRAAACGPDFYAALAAALAKLETRLHRSHDRRRVHHGRHRFTSVAEATATLTTSPVAAHTPHMPTPPVRDYG